LSSDGDCIIGPKPDSEEAKFKIREKDASYEAQVKGAVQTITSSMKCYVVSFSIKVNLNLFNFGEQAALHFSSVSNDPEEVSLFLVCYLYIFCTLLIYFNTEVNGFSRTYLYMSFSIRCFVNMICTVTGPTVVDSQGYQSSVTDRCMYSLLSDSSSSFEVLANFQERRRRDVSFLDSVSLRPVGSNDYFHLEQGGRVKTVLTLNSSAQQIQNIMLSKDKTGLSAVFSFSGLKISVMFDGYTAQIHMNAELSFFFINFFHFASCERQYEDPFACFQNKMSLSFPAAEPQAFCQDKLCGDHEFCGNKHSGKPGCLCRALFASKYKVSGTLGEPAVCKQNSGSITLVGCLLEEKGIDYSVLHLNDQSCRGVMDEESHTVTFSFDSTKQEITRNGSQVNYENTIMTQNSSDVITRHDQVYIDFSCHHTQPEIKVVELRIKDNSVVQHIKSGEWSYSVSMKAYVNAGYTKPIDSAVLLNQKIWVELKTDGLDANTVAVVMDSCWATSQESDSSKPRYDLINDGCANPNDGTVEVEANGEGTSCYFSYNMFEFSGSAGEVYLHCKLQLCPKQQNNCIPDCSGGFRRRRRSATLRDGDPGFISLAWIH
uniref:ZP domain-containing protein n=1 Tax=Cyprinodon variegatus TaxID=28743 RepID=A0A3Q2G8W4_CYPVA